MKTNRSDQPYPNRYPPHIKAGHLVTGVNELHSAEQHSLTCAGWSLWQPRRHCISLKSRLLRRQEVGICEWWWCHIGGSYQRVARVTELQCALIGWLDCDWHGEGRGRSCRLLQSGTTILVFIVQQLFFHFTSATSNSEQNVHVLHTFERFYGIIVLLKTVVACTVYVH